MKQVNNVKLAKVIMRGHASWMPGSNLYMTFEFAARARRADSRVPYPSAGTPCDQEPLSILAAAITA